MSSQGDLFNTREDKPLPPVAPELWGKLARSAFRRKFHLNAEDLSYLQEKTLPVVLEHGADFITKRLAPAHPARDGKQTPWKGHPVFVAQHATGTCCRSCLEKWHNFSKGLQLTDLQKRYVLAVIAGWLEHELDTAQKRAAEQNCYPEQTKKGAGS
ncbi:DUF4186 domain-containing protein [Acetobacter cerevisiae]|uniref:DUF4186 domain-containing protein n=1 Tax=Acetobacter cerevisiae TaxID=178900 RepID=A0ABT1END8_9PROT|nr:DUF4186 domain-containing protein [Acetobacter cerevisiae]MCP1244890.1 DUF4186 domain-containing protein [Acetobacter cerevisiae]MCP1254467.1 DUF4186 domain-containing protein [Acetobacter cerevisiae]